MYASLKGTQYPQAQLTQMTLRVLMEDGWPHAAAPHSWGVPISLRWSAPRAHMLGPERW